MVIHCTYKWARWVCFYRTCGLTHIYSHEYSKHVEQGGGERGEEGRGGRRGGGRRRGGGARLREGERKRREVGETEGSRRERGREGEIEGGREGGRGTRERGYIIEKSIIIHTHDR